MFISKKEPTPPAVAVPPNRSVEFRRGGDRPGRDALASFADAAWVRSNPALSFRPGAVFLGRNDCRVSSKLDARGRSIRVAEGGQAVGIVDDRHLVTIAGSRAGKSRSVLLNNLALYPGSMIVIDPKGDLANETARFREATFGPTYVLDPFDQSGASRSTPGRPHAFNPLDTLAADSPTLVEDAGLIAEALVADEPGEKDPHWNESARQLITGLILHVATCPLYEGRRTLPTVADCVNRALDVVEYDDGTSELQLLAEILRSAGTPPHARIAIEAAAAAFYDKAADERSSVLSITRRHLRLLTLQSMRTVLGHTSSGLDLRRLKRDSRLTKGITLYLSLPVLRMGTCAGWLRMIVNLALAAFEQEPAAKGPDPLPVLMCLDEFHVLGRMKTLETAAGQIAGLGCRLWIIVQDLTQLQDLYDKRWETFLGNAGVVQCFGNTDLTTLEWISRRCGTTLVERTSQAFVSLKQQTATGDQGQTLSYAEHPLITPEEASRHFARDDWEVRQLVFVAGEKPLVLHRTFFDQDELFKHARTFDPLRP